MVKKPQKLTYRMNWLVTSKKTFFFIECIYLVSTNNKNQALSIYRMPMFWKMISQPLEVLEPKALRWEVTRKGYELT